MNTGVVDPNSCNSSGPDILEQYRNISNKLKKRFLRKPNLTEACDSFAALGRQCESAELPTYAGLCWISAARCDGSVSNLPGEISCLLNAARQFALAELNDHNLNCISPSNENLQAALSCYEHCAAKYHHSGDQSELIPSVSLNLEIVDLLRKIGKDHQYIEYYLSNALELVSDTTLFDTKIYCLRLLGENSIADGDYSAALDTFTQIASIIDCQTTMTNGAHCADLLQCEINRVLILLILRSAPQKLSPQFAKLLEKYSWADRTDGSLKACQMPEKLFLLLQSLVTICQSLDTSNLVELEGEFWPFLTKQQKELLRVLVRIYCY